MVWEKHSFYPFFRGDMQVLRPWANAPCILFMFLQLNKGLIGLTRKIQLRSSLGSSLQTLWVMPRAARCEGCFPVRD